MIIVIGSRKGGSGKSTLATNIACSIAHKNEVMLVDADRQPTSSSWAEERENQNVPQVICMQKYGNLQKNLIDLHKRYDYVVVDCSGRDSTEWRSALTCADILLVPVRPSQADLETLEYTRQLVEEMSMTNPNMHSYVVLTQAPSNPHVNEISEAINFISNYPLFHPVSQIIYDRKVYRDALSSGLGVIEIDNIKASQEINGLMQEIFNDKNKNTKNQI